MNMVEEDNLGKHFILIDSHVHIYSYFEMGRFLDFAWDNFEKALSRRGEESKFDGVLFLAETNETMKYSQLRDYARESNTDKGSETGNWDFYYTGESTCLRANQGNRQNIFIIAGRQVITEEKLEVLALATDHNFADGTPLRELIKQINENDGIPVIPWGVGKWWRERGAFLKSFIMQNRDSNFFLGDNGGRPSFWLHISHFQLALEHGIRILRGTDPLPLTREVKRPGSFGFMLLNTLNVSKPSFHLKQMLRDNTIHLIDYGNLQNPIRFFLNQFFLKLSNQKYKL